MLCSPPARRRVAWRSELPGLCRRFSHTPGAFWREIPPHETLCPGQIEDQQSILLGGVAGVSESDGPRIGEFVEDLEDRGSGGTVR
ncbi:protein of unknown function [Kyrpidia spormannii]|uniref:Uncharacterized protein n=1 Tax=Kyrpidia spormannii TaxID=2055160 RepID=A0A6F9E8N7_9BACL|nr:protein of unknown function [Kyrpidia spormannii]